MQINTWADVASLTADDLKPYKTVIMDTAGRALDKLSADIMADNHKLATGGALNQRGFGVLKTRFTSFLNLLTSSGLDVVLIVHMSEEKRGDEIVERLDVQGGSKGEIYKSADAMGRLIIENGARWLKFDPTDASFGKNPGQIEAIQIPHFTHPDFNGFLGRVIQRTKDEINKLTEDQRLTVAAQDDFRAAVAKTTKVDEVNALIAQAKAGGPVMISALHKHATEKLGLLPDKTAGNYAEKPKTDEAPKAEPVKESEAA